MRNRGLLERIAFPPIRTFDSSCTPKRGERLAIPRTLAQVDLTAIVAALSGSGGEAPKEQKEDRSSHARLEPELAAARAWIATLEENNRELHLRLAKIAAMAAGAIRAPGDAAKIAAEPQPKTPGAKPVRPSPVATSDSPTASGNGIHPAARKLLTALRSMRRRVSPGARLRRSPVSNRAAGISIPGARFAGGGVCCRDKRFGNISTRRAKGRR